MSKNWTSKAERNSTEDFEEMSRLMDQASTHIVRADIPSNDDFSDFATSDSDGENSLRPKLLDEFLGQKDIKENLSVFINAARERKDGQVALFARVPHL